MIRSIEEVSDLEGKRVLVRAALNVPIQNGTVTDPLRLELAMKTIELLLSRGARVILMSHMSDTTGTLEPVFQYLKKKIPLDFVRDVAGEEAHTAAASLEEGRALLLENLRRDVREEQNDEEFAQALSSLADLYVNDDFTVSHRAHAAIVRVPGLLPGYGGLQFMEELRGLTPALTPPAPSLAILGGAKLKTKLALLESLLQKYDRVFVGGALANDFFKAKGFEVGKSLVSDDVSAARSLLGNPKILLPEIVTALTQSGKEDARISAILPEDTILDIAPASIEMLQPHITEAQFVLWNGPMGNFEKGFREGTDRLAKAVADAPGRSVVGGGDTLASIQNLGIMDTFEFVSTAGGAMLDFLAHGTLPGIKALERA